MSATDFIFALKLALMMASLQAKIGVYGDTRLDLKNYHLQLLEYIGSFEDTLIT